MKRAWVQADKVRRKNDERSGGPGLQSGSACNKRMSFIHRLLQGWNPAAARTHCTILLSGMAANPASGILVEKSQTCPFFRPMVRCTIIASYGAGIGMSLGPDP